MDPKKASLFLAELGLLECPSVLITPVWNAGFCFVFSESFSGGPVCRREVNQQNEVLPCAEVHIPLVQTVHKQVEVPQAGAKSLAKPWPPPKEQPKGNTPRKVDANNHTLAPFS